MHCDWHQLYALGGYTNYKKIDIILYMKQHRYMQACIWQYKCIMYVMKNVFIMPLMFIHVNVQCHYNTSTVFQWNFLNVKTTPQRCYSKWNMESSYNTHTTILSVKTTPQWCYCNSFSPAPIVLFLNMQVNTFKVLPHHSYFNSVLE